VYKYLGNQSHETYGNMNGLMMMSSDGLCVNGVSLQVVVSLAQTAKDAF